MVSPEDIFHQIMSINAASGSLEAKVSLQSQLWEGAALTPHLLAGLHA